MSRAFYSPVKPAAPKEEETKHKTADRQRRVTTVQTIHHYLIRALYQM